MKIKMWWFIIPILLFASLVRLYHLESVPPSPYWEEVALGYDAYSIAQTGKDHHGNPYPIIAFPSYGDYKPSGYFYAIVPFVKLLGLSVLAVRLPSALAGIMSVGLLYLIGKRLFDERTGLLAAVFMAISPWAIQFSRGGWEVNLALMLLLAGTWTLLLAIKKPWYLLVSVTFFAISMYTYHAARLFAPMIGGIGGLSLLVYYFKHNRKGMLSAAASFVLTLILVAPLALNLNNKEVSSRFSDTSIFSNLQPILDSNAAIASHGGTKVAKIIYHRDWYFGAIILKQFASHFSPSFLFVRGDGNFRHGGWTGLLYPIEATFIFASICISLISFRKRKTINYRILALVLWILLAAVAPSLVTPAPHALRFLFAVPAFLLLAAYAVRTLVFSIPKGFQNVFIFVLLTIYLFSFTKYFSEYLTIYPVRAQKDWQYGYEQMYNRISELKEPGEQVYVSRNMGRPAMYYLFFSKFDPSQLQRIEPALPKDQLELLQVGDYHFVDGVPNGAGIFALPTGTPLVGGKIIGNVNGLDGISIWTLWRK